jgi:hypothetical protein
MGYTNANFQADVGNLLLYVDSLLFPVLDAGLVTEDAQLVALLG